MSGSFDISAVKEALAAKILAAYQAAGWRCNVYAYPPVDPLAPCVMIDTGPVEYHQTFGTVGVAGLTLTITVRVSAGSAREVDALMECDRVLSTGTPESLFDAVSLNRYALTGVDGWAIVLTSATGPELRSTVDGAREWYSITFTAALARAKG